jgi:hypothetical protein
MGNEPKVQTLGETENYVVWVSNEPDDDNEELYHIELSNVTLHLFPEEWEEFTALIMQAVR